MILWLTGNSGSGKTTLAYYLQLYIPNSIVLDGDEIRNSISEDLDLSKEHRIENNIRIAKLAKILYSQNFNIIISVIAPYKEGRDLVNKIIDCTWIYLEGGKTGSNYPYEISNYIKFKSLQQMQNIIKEIACSDI